MKRKKKFETDLHHLQSLMGVRGTKVFFWCYLFVKILWLVEIYLQGNVVFHQPGILPSAYFPWVIRNEMMSKMTCLCYDWPHLQLVWHRTWFVTKLSMWLSLPHHPYMLYLFSIGKDRVLLSRLTQPWFWHWSTLDSLVCVCCIAFFVQYISKCNYKWPAD